jgi:hypothetical protein
MRYPYNRYPPTFHSSDCSESETAQLLSPKKNLRHNQQTVLNPSNSKESHLLGCGFCKNNVSEERSASIIRVKRIGELGMLAVTSHRCMLRRNAK